MMRSIAPTFAGLFFAASRSARAETPTSLGDILGAPDLGAAMAEGQAARAPLPVLASWTERVEDGTLVLQLTLKNSSDVPLDLLIARGRSPGALVDVTMDGVALERSFTSAEAMDATSRIGPMPRYSVLAAGKSTDAGTFRFALPAGHALGALKVHAVIDAEQGRATLDSSLSAPQA